jgi:hypothetical protein
LVQIEFDGYVTGVLTVFLIALIVYIILGIIGFAVHGLIWLFVIAAVLFVGHLIFITFRRGNQRATR